MKIIFNKIVTNGNKYGGKHLKKNLICGCMKGVERTHFGFNI